MGFCPRLIRPQKKSGLTPALLRSLSLSPTLSSNSLPKDVEPKSISPSLLGPSLNSSLCPSNACHTYVHYSRTKRFHFSFEVPTRLFHSRMWSSLRVFTQKSRVQNVFVYVGLHSLSHTKNDQGSLKLPHVFSGQGPPQK